MSKTTIKPLLSTTLHIANQSGLLNQISSVYSSFYRAAMEYVDNAADASANIRQAKPSFVGNLLIQIDTAGRTVSFTDDCGGMAPAQLVNLLASVGESSKGSQSWTNGQFGFGVHAFRGFARYAQFISVTKTTSASITIDSNASDDTVFDCLPEPRGVLPTLGTRVTVSGFRSHVFVKNFFATGIITEIQRHFDDVLRSGLLKIGVAVDKAPPVELNAFDFDALSGIPLQTTNTMSNGVSIVVNLKVLDKLQDDRAPILANKGRRIQLISELRSYRQFAKLAGRNISVWQNPFVTGAIEINGFVQPTLTRDDLKEGDDRAELYSLILKVQLDLEELVRERLDKKKEDAYSKLADKMSECLSAILRKYRIRFEGFAGTAAGQGQATATGDDVPFGGTEPGGGGPGGDGIGGGGTKKGTGGESGPGESESGAGTDGPGSASSDGSGVGTGTAAAPQIRFSSFPKEPGRVISFGSTLTVNTGHTDFKLRQPAGAHVSQRMIGYVAQVVAGPCVEFLYARRGKPLIAAAVADQVADISIALEAAFSDSGMLSEIYASSFANE